MLTAASFIVLFDIVVMKEIINMSIPRASTSHNIKYHVYDYSNYYVKCVFMENVYRVEFIFEYTGNQSLQY